MRSVGLLLSLWLIASTAQAQDDAVARLRAQVASAPSDVSLQCQLSFALIGASQHEEARTIATAAIAAVPRPLTRATRRTLGACLYNLGRAEEGLGHRREAAIAYARSIVVRDNDAVRARLAALSPAAPADDEMAALALFALEAEEEGGTAQRSTRVRAGADTFHFVPITTTVGMGYTAFVLVVVAIRDDAVALARVDDWTQEDNGGSMTVTGSRAWPSASAAQGALATVEAAGGGACGRMDGFMDFEHHATVLVSFDGTRVRARALVTQQSDCEGHVSQGLAVQRDQVVVRRSRGGDLPPGTYTIRSLLR
jgi:hypothetical protein